MGNEQDKVGTAGAGAPGAAGGAAGEPSWGDVMRYPLGCVGAFLGALVGAWVVHLASKSGFYAVPLMGLTVGLGTTLLARRDGLAMGVIAAVVTLAGQGFVEWKWLWHGWEDGSLEYFVRHVGDLPGFRLLVHGVGVGLGFWMGWRRWF